MRHFIEPLSIIHIFKPGNCLVFIIKVLTMSQGIKDIGINGAYLLAETLAGQEGCIKGTKVDIAGKCLF